MSVARLTTDGGLPAPTTSPGRRLRNTTLRVSSVVASVASSRKRASIVKAAAASTETSGIAPAVDHGANRFHARRAHLQVGADELAGDGVLQQPLGDPRRLRVRVLRLEEAEQHHRQEAQAGQDAEIEVNRIERPLHDLRVGRQDGEALLSLRAKQLEVEIDVGLGADALQEALDDLCFHQTRTDAKVVRAVSSSEMVTNSSAAWA